ncbi:hypothetical protein BGZ47_009926 [Haplosporangium gracile]|nr:hypothetical protein BGZ47_009926 [Haplosporangium gracile]
MFKWAIQEKNDLEATGWNTAVGNTQAGQRFVAQDEISQRAHRIPGLVPLQHIDIGLTSLSSTDDIEDIVFAFSQSLKHLTIRFFDYSYLDLPDSIHVGRGWIDLPALTQLHLNSACVEWR